MPHFPETVKLMLWLTPFVLGTVSHVDQIMLHSDVGYALFYGLPNPS